MLIHTSIALCLNIICNKSLKIPKGYYDVVRRVKAMTKIKIANDDLQITALDICGDYLCFYYQRAYNLHMGSKVPGGSIS